PQMGTRSPNVRRLKEIPGPLVTERNRLHIRAVPRIARRGPGSRRTAAGRGSVPQRRVRRAMQSVEYDAIVVGSGISGGWAAKELTEKGLRVLLLERGKNIEHIKDYVNATKGPWEYPHRGGHTKAMEDLYPVLKRDYPLNEKNLDYWANDKESPDTQGKRLAWYSR